ncbi:MAG: flagellar biosynthetic protein FliR [Bryobacterales bacterium]|nr:flagellar biosynthetic protein FliR [Bryobacterales bacterium]
MPGDAAINTGTLLSFLVVLARVSGIFAFISFPGMRQGPEPIRAFFALSFTIALMPLWPVLPNASPSLGQFTGWLLSEAAFGIAIGLSLAVVTEVFLLTAQLLSLQSGLSYASAVDPTSTADSGALTLVANLAAGLLVFSTGLHRQIILAIAHSLELLPPGAYMVQSQTAIQIFHFAGTIFGTGLRLAMPVMAFLLMLDLGLALMGRLSPGLGLFTLAFPLKIILTLFICSELLTLFPRIFERLAKLCLSLVNAQLPAPF